MVLNMFCFFFRKPRSREDLYHHGNSAIVEGTVGLIATGLGLLLLSPVLTSEMGAGVAVILVALIVVGVVSLLSCVVGILNRQAASAAP